MGDNNAQSFIRKLIITKVLLIAVVAIVIVILMP
jgi:hypothetical protein